MNNDEKRLLREAERLISRLPSYVFFADEQVYEGSLLFGGYFLHRTKLSVLDNAVASAKAAFGLPPEAPIKATPPDNESYLAIRKLSSDRRVKLSEAILGILNKIEATCFFSMVWKFDPKALADAYKWAFKSVLQRLIITVERNTRGTCDVWYPALDTVVDWFPIEKHCKEFFGTYDEAYHKGYDFSYIGKNKLPPLKKFGACPCLVVGKCEFSPALQLADYCVYAMGRFLKWAYKRDLPQEDIQKRIEPVARHLLRGPGGVIGYGLVLPTKGAARDKVREALINLGLP